MLGIVSGNSIVFHWSVCQFLCQYHTVLMTIALQYIFVSETMIPPALFLIFLFVCFWLVRVFLVIFGFQECFPTSIKYAIGILIEIALSLQMAFGSIDIFTVLILPIHQHVLPNHHLLESSLFHQCLTIFIAQIFHLLG